MIGPELINGFYLSKPSEKDIKPFVKYLNGPLIMQNTLQIPHPYRKSDAIDWFEYVAEQERLHSRIRYWVIRNPKGKCAGGIGFNADYKPNSHKDEIGYWLGAPFRGKGVMTSAVRVVSQIGMEAYGYARIEANVFAGNEASVKVLERCGYEYEGICRKLYKKKDRYIDALRYALVR